MPTTPSQYSGLPNKLVRAANGVDYAYRDTGPEATGVPLVLFQHFRGNLDSWDPALIDALAAARRVITFDNAGVGGFHRGQHRTASSRWPGTLSPSSPAWNSARLTCWALHRQLHRPADRADEAGHREKAGPGVLGAAGRRGHARLGPEVIGAVGTPETSPGEYLGVFFTRSPASRQAGQQAVQRMYARTEDRDAATTWATREAQYDAVCTWGIPTTQGSSGSAAWTCRCS